MIEDAGHNLPASPVIAGRLGLNVAAAHDGRGRGVQPRLRLSSAKMEAWEGWAKATQLAPARAIAAMARVMRRMGKRAPNSPL